MQINSNTKQINAALRNCGYVEPETMDEYIVRGGYKALDKYLAEMTPKQVLADAKMLKPVDPLFPASLKWKLTAKKKAAHIESTNKERYLMEVDANCLVEAMILCGYATGATMGVVTIPAEYPFTLERVKVAVAEAAEKGYLGEGIKGKDFNFTIEVREAEAAYSCSATAQPINVAMGVTLDEMTIVDGTAVLGHQFKVLQASGPATNVAIMDETIAMPNLALTYLKPTLDKYCGKCSPCRIGNKRLCEILEQVIAGNGTMEQLNKFRNLAIVIRDSARCALGQTSSNISLAIVENFWQEFAEKVADKKADNSTLVTNNDIDK